jgi:hypothetical protein
MNTLPLSKVAAATLAVALSASAHAATWSSSDQYGSWTTGSYSFNNDIWGSGAGPQTIWANSSSDWGVWSNQPNTGGIKSYPHIAYPVGKSVSALSTLKSTVSATTPSGGAWESTYDIWDNGNAHEIMLWLNYTGTSLGCGNVKPISYNWTAQGCAIPVYTNVTVGGGTWNVYRGNNGANDVFSFLRTSKTNNTTVDIKAILNYIVGLGWMGNVTVSQVQYGFEITSASGGLDYHAQNFSVTAK